MWNALFVISIIFLILSFLGVIVVLTFLLPVFQGAPFVATEKKRVQKILDVADIKVGDMIADIGSGDGRLVIAFAQVGIMTYGFEINPFLVWWSKFVARRKGVSKKTKFIRANFWQTNFSEYDVVFVFGIPYIMGRLGKKLQNELPKGAKIISNGFHIPDMKLVKKDGQIFVYEV